MLNLQIVAIWQFFVNMTNNLSIVMKLLQVKLYDFVQTRGFKLMYVTKS